MKSLIKGFLLPLVVSMIFGFICAKLVYSVYGDELENKLSSSRIYLIQNGKYSTYDSMREDNNGNNYVYYMDDGKYNTVVGITKNEDNIEKIKSLYSDDVNVLEYYISTDLLDDKMSEYDKELANTDDIYKVKEVVDNMLSLYREDDTIRLVLVN